MSNTKPLPYEKAYNPRMGRTVTRAEWEKSHKPTCNVYPCSNWPEIHWHISNMKLFDVKPKESI